MRALLDVNVIIALLDSGHVMHAFACTWLERNLNQGWATCPLTQTGVVRIMAQPAYPNTQPAQQVATRLAEACGHPSHAFWPQQISLLRVGLIRWERILGPRQITDAYLLALAVAHGGRLVSFDQRLDPQQVPGATASHLCVISAGGTAAGGEAAG
jgi:toxin-antitoxin system PIN domain toxin